ncbi:papain fold toxin domain-containing protein [Microcoleus sp. bin48.metabat.b7b8b9.023]
MRRHQKLFCYFPPFNGEELIFDNIHNEGISKQEWLGKFYCLAIEF